MESLEVAEPILAHGKSAERFYDKIPFPQRPVRTAIKHVQKTNGILRKLVGLCWHSTMLASLQLV